MKNTIPRVRWKFVNWLAIATFTILSLLLLILSILIEDVFWSTVFNQLSTILLISGIWAIIYEMFLRTDFIRITDENTEKIINYVRVSDEMEKLGLLEIREDSLTFDYKPMFLESKELDIVINHGRTWVSRNSFILRKRFQDPTKKTRIFMLHPDSPMIEVISRKEGLPVSGVKDKISDAIRMLNEIRTETTQLEIYGHFLFNPFSILLADEYAVSTGYYFALGRRTVPLYKFGPIEGDCFFKVIKEDIEALIDFSEEISGFSINTVSATDENSVIL